MISKLIVCPQNVMNFSLYFTACLSSCHHLVFVVFIFGHLHLAGQLTICHYWAACTFHSLLTKRMHVFIIIVILVTSVYIFFVLVIFITYISLHLLLILFL